MSTFQYPLAFRFDAGGGGGVDQQRHGHTSKRYRARCGGVMLTYNDVMQ